MIEVKVSRLQGYALVLQTHGDIPIVLGCDSDAEMGPDVPTWAVRTSQASAQVKVLRASTMKSFSISVLLIEIDG